MLMRKVIRHTRSTSNIASCEYVFSLKTVYFYNLRFMSTTENVFVHRRVMALTRNSLHA